MMVSPETSRLVPRALLVLALALTVVLPYPAAAIDVFSRDSEETLLLRQPRRLKGLQATVEVRFLTVGNEFLERVGVDFSGSVRGEVSRRGQAVENAKVILEVFAVRSAGNPPNRTQARTGRQTVTTDSSGEFRFGLKNLVDPDTRAEILAGKVAALVIEATGKNGKKIDLLHLRVSTVMGGLIP